MKFLNYVLPLGCAAALFCSCQSTRVYTQSSQELYEDDILIAESSTVIRHDYADEQCEQFQGNKVIQDSTTRYFDFSEDYTVVSNTDEKTTLHLFTAESVREQSDEYENFTFSLVEAEIIKKSDDVNSSVIGTREFRMKDGAIVPFDGGSRFKGGSFSEEDEVLFVADVEKLLASLADGADSSDVKKTHSQTSKTSSEKVKVVSTPNSSYITYSILGKPFVILGTSCWQILKCIGYAFINFSGGYSAATGGDAYWKMPSYLKSKQKAQEAKAANAIQHYPEYHLPFTDNKIIVETYDKNINVVSLEDESELIVPIEKYEYDNTMSVSRAAKADAASTAATAGLIGTIITIPISGLTWVFGAVFGAFYGNK